MSRHADAGDDFSSHAVDAASASRHAVSGVGEEVTSQRRHGGARDVADRVAGLLVRQCRSWTTRLGSADDVPDCPPTSNSLSPSSPTSPGAAATVSRPPPSPRPSLTGGGGTVPPRPFPTLESSSPPSSVCLFASSSTEDVVVVDYGAAAAAVPAGSDTSSGRGSASPDTRSSSSRGARSRFKKILRPLRRTWSAGCSDDFRTFDDATTAAAAAAHKTSGVQQVDDGCFIISIDLHRSM